MHKKNSSNRAERQMKMMDLMFVVSIFAFSIVLVSSPAEIYLSYIPIFILLPFFVLKYAFPRKLIFIFFPLLLTGIVSVYLGENESRQFIKIFAGLLVSSAFFHYLIEHYSFNIKRLFKVYLNVALFIGCVGLMQLFAHRLGIKPLYSLNWIFNKWGTTAGGLGIRVNAIFSEPSYYATTLAPAFFVACFNLINKKPTFISKRWSLLMVLAYPISFSSLGFLVIFIAIVILLLRFGYLKFAVLFLPLSAFVFLFIYSTSPEFKDRFDSTLEVFTAEEFSQYEVNGSSFILYDNYQVAVKNLKQNPFFGTSLGSHKFAFEKYSLTNDLIDIGLDSNAQDANSLILRTMSETGLFGLVFLIGFFFKNYQSYNSAINEEVWLMSTGILIMMLVYTLRQGHYFYNGLQFFMWSYYYLKQMSKYPEKYGLKPS